MEPALMGAIIIACCFAAGVFSDSPKKRDDHGSARCARAGIGRTRRSRTNASCARTRSEASSATRTDGTDRNV